MNKRNVLCLFDVDGTLTKPRQIIDNYTYNFLTTNLLPKCAVGLVGGSDLCKIQEQMGGSSFVLSDLDYVFAENGLVAIKNGEEIAKQSIQNHLGEVRLQKLINRALYYMSEIELPLKRGTFVEFRTGLVNLCPVGRSCSQEERDLFAKYDAEYKVREKLIRELENDKDLSELGLKFSIGGQISIDVFPVGWDKTYCLKYVENEFKNNIHFFGDKTSPGGNDYEIFTDSRVIGHSVTSPKDTIQQLQAIFEIE